MNRLSTVIILLVPAMSMAATTSSDDAPKPKSGLFGSFFAGHPGHSWRYRQAQARQAQAQALQEQAQVAKPVKVAKIKPMNMANKAATPTDAIATDTASLVTSTNSAVNPAVTPITPSYYGAGLCAYADAYQCIKIGHGDSWTSLFPNEDQRDLVQRINRSYNALWVGKTIAVPKNLNQVTLNELSPFPQQINEQEKQVIVDQDKLAWAAYDAHGQLVKWGPISSGIDKCPDSANACRTLTGIYRVFSKENEKCKSDIFPIGKGGAKMPYCMYFHKGFALHGSDDMPGYRASHGCVRMFIRDAKWLNEYFVETSTDKNNNMGTKVVVRPVTAREKIL